MIKHSISAKEIKDFRLGIKITQEELAGKIFVNWATVNRLEKGHNKMSSSVYRSFIGFCKGNDRKLYDKLQARNG